jgi:hypothetical protein
VKLVDKTGWFARCDAVILAEDGEYTPPDAAEELERERLRLKGQPTEPEECGEWDVVVVGAGTTGMGACVAAACSSPEHPLRTALGQLACAACAVAGLLYAARLENGGIWVEPRMDAVAVAVSFSLLMAIVGALIGAGNTSKEQL